MGLYLADKCVYCYTIAFILFIPVEMLSIPSVWDTVETTAKNLLSNGEVTLSNRENYKLAYDSNVASIYSIPKWKKRIKVKI